jgi:hypothetical protein
MMFFAKPVLTVDFYIVQKSDVPITRYMCDTHAWRKVKHIHKRQIHHVERMLHKDYVLKGSVEKRISGRESQGA